MKLLKILVVSSFGLVLSGSILGCAVRERVVEPRPVVRERVVVHPEPVVRERVIVP